MAPKTTSVRGKTHLVQVLGQRRHRMRVVRHIQHHHGLAGQDLEATEQLDEAEPCADGLGPHRQTLVQRLKNGQHPDAFSNWLTPQRWVGQPREAALAARPLPLLAITTEVEVAAQLAQVCAQLGRTRGDGCWGHGVAAHRRSASAQDARLLAPDRFAVRPQELGVVEVNAGDDGAIGVDDIHRIQTPPKPTSRITRSSGSCCRRRKMARW